YLSSSMCFFRGYHWKIPRNVVSGSLLRRLPDTTFRVIFGKTRLSWPSPRQASYLPTLGARPALERPDYVGRYPAAVEAAGHRLGHFAIHQTAVHELWIEGHVVADQRVGRRRLGIRPGCLIDSPVANHDIKVVRQPFPLAQRHLLASVQVSHLHIG